jgi:hypothetical protein
LVVVGWGGGGGICQKPDVRKGVTAGTGQSHAAVVLHCTVQCGTLMYFSWTLLPVCVLIGCGLTPGMLVSVFFPLLAPCLAPLLFMSVSAQISFLLASRIPMPG